MSEDDRVATLRALHSGAGFVIPNAWDGGTARILAQCGFSAVASTSAGIAWSTGVPDGGALPLGAMLARLAEIVAAVDVPVSADLEAGYGTTSEEVARTVGEAVAIGAAGGNIEDAADGRLFESERAVERLAAARDAAPPDAFVLNARTDAYFVGGVDDPFAETVERAQGYVAVGADCIFVPGVRDEETIRRLVHEIAAPVNVVAGLTSPVIAVPTLFALGVKRVSVGGSLARAAFSAVERAGRELQENGTLGFLDGAASYADLQRRFGA